ncbi:MAG TPA: RNA polymerase sigma factor [Longimicrobiales bacterium]|nr:RNA polymerase sigma factor [Longimicrobiales bacterium]
MKSTTDPPVHEAIDSSAVAERYRASIYRYILRLVGEPARADDLTQETFLRVHQRIGGLRDPAAVEAWLYRIATNLCYDGFRQREHRVPPLPLVSLRGEGGAVLSDEAALQPDHMLEHSEMSGCVLRFLSDLPDPLREVLLLHDLQGFTGPEMADRLGLSIHNVKIRLHRARVRLRAALSEGCDFSRDDRGVFVCQPKRPTPD